MIICILSSCIAYEEKEFKNSVKHLKQLLIKLNSIRTPIEGSNVKPNVYYIDRKEFDTFILEKKNEWEKLSKQFKTYMINTESCWADDAGFCLVIMYLSISQRENNYSVEAINEIRTFLAIFPCIHIENWTKKEFRDVSTFEIFFNKKNVISDKFVQEILNLPEQKRIRNFFRRAIIQELLKLDKTSEAKENLETLERESEEKLKERQLKERELFIGLGREISQYEEMKKKLR